MTAKRRRFTADFKKRVALEALRGDRTIQELAAKHEVHPNQVGAWKKQAVEGLGEVFASSLNSGAEESLAKELYAKVGELTMVERDGPLSLSRQCELLAIGRASLYREPAGESAANAAPDFPDSGRSAPSARKIRPTRLRGTRLGPSGQQVRSRRPQVLPARPTATGSLSNKGCDRP